MSICIRQWGFPRGLPRSDLRERIFFRRGTGWREKLPRGEISRRCELEVGSEQNLFTSSHKTYFKQNTKIYTSNYHILLFLINVKIFKRENIDETCYVFIDIIFLKIT
jgi:hypothetical protein